MALWIEVKVRYEKMMDSGKTVKVTDPYLVDALSCTEAEARVIKEITPHTSEFNVLNVGKTKISEIFWNASGDKFYKVKVNFITLDEKTASEKRSASYILVQASNFDEALANFHKGMKGTMADYEIESISETRYVDVYTYQANTENKPAPSDVSAVAEKVASSPAVRKAIKDFKDSVPEGCTVSVSATDGVRTMPETVIADKSHTTGQ